MGLLKDILGGFSDLFGTGYNIYQDQRNFNYTKDLQEELFKRDDNAMQRRMADLSAAGVNPLLALGSSAAGNTSAGSPGSVGVASPDFKILERKQQQQSLEIGEEQIKSIFKDNQMKDVNLDIKKMEKEILQKQLKQYDDSGYYPQSWLGKGAMDLNNILGEVFGDVFQQHQKPNFFHPFELYQQVFPGGFNIPQPKPIEIKNPFQSSIDKRNEKKAQKEIQKKFDEDFKEWQKIIKNQNSRLKLIKHDGYFTVSTPTKAYDKKYTRLQDMQRDYYLPLSKKN